MQSIPPTTADKQTQAHKRRGSMSRKLLGAKAKSIHIHNYINIGPGISIDMGLAYQ